MRDRDAWISRIDAAYTKEAIDNFLEAHFKSASSKELDIVREQIAREVKAPDGDYEYCLYDMARDGVQGIRKYRRNRFSRYVRQNAWVAIKALLKPLVALMIFEKLNDSFQIIATALMIILYTQVRRGVLVLDGATAANNQAAYVRYLSTKGLANFEPTPEEYAALWTLGRENAKGMIQRLVADLGQAS